MFEGEAGMLVAFPFASYANPELVARLVDPSMLDDMAVPVCPAVGVFVCRFPNPSYPNDGPQPPDCGR